jgi:hypothetical protein
MINQMPGQTGEAPKLETQDLLLRLTWRWQMGKEQWCNDD